MGDQSSVRTGGAHEGADRSGADITFKRPLKTTNKQQQTTQEVYRDEEDRQGGRGSGRTGTNTNLTGEEADALGLTLTSLGESDLESRPQRGDSAPGDASDRLREGAGEGEGEGEGEREGEREGAEGKK